MTNEDITRLFTYRKPTSEEAAQMTRISEALEHAARIIVTNTPEGADQTCAIRHLVDARMTANKAIIHGGGPLHGRTPPSAEPPAEV